MIDDFVWFCMTSERRDDLFVPCLDRIEAALGEVHGLCLPRTAAAAICGPLDGLDRGLFNILPTR